MKVSPELAQQERLDDAYAANHYAHRKADLLPVDQARAAHDAADAQLAAALRQITAVMP